MKLDDFRYMHQGRQLADLTSEELKLLKPVDKRGSGKGHALLLLHGFSSSPAVYRYLIPEIKAYDAIVCPVLPGHAASIDEFSNAKAKDWLSTASKTCEELVQQYQKVDVLGLSLGGLLACELSQLYPLHHLYLLAPALCLNFRVNALMKFAQVMHFLGFCQVRNSAGNIFNEAGAEIAYRKLPISTIIEMLHLAKNYQWVAPTCPVDLFLGAHDQVVAAKEVEKLFFDLPNVTIHWLKNSAHVLPLDSDLQVIIDCVNQQ